MNIPLFNSMGNRVSIGGAFGVPKATTPSGYYSGRTRFVGKKRRGVFVGTQEEAAALRAQLRSGQNLELANRRRNWGGTGGIFR